LEKATQAIKCYRPTKSISRQMNNQKPLVNRVAKSGIVTLNLEDYFPAENRLIFDLSDYLFRGLILREKDFREALSTHDWLQYQDQNLSICCTAEAIIPIWAYQLVSIKAAPFAKHIFMGSEKAFLEAYYYQTLQAIDWSIYQDKRIVIKGCGEKPVPVSAYAELARLLTPVAKRIMYGEPCSMVPLYKK
jgi:hypothetical protein